mmetsp:Transcript_75511/g.179363  ORF Transcript_75511/g.179363 Transcript_75511/m.179363 type:complete len:276 (+) Transcript_75511:373-1200(+)
MVRLHHVFVPTVSSGLLFKPHLTLRQLDLLKCTNSPRLVFQSNKVPVCVFYCLLLLQVLCGGALLRLLQPPGHILLGLLQFACHLRPHAVQVCIRHAADLPHSILLIGAQALHQLLRALIRCLRLCQPLSLAHLRCRDFLCTLLPGLLDVLLRLLLKPLQPIHAILDLLLMFCALELDEPLKAPDSLLIGNGFLHGSVLHLLDSPLRILLDFSQNLIHVNLLQLVQFSSRSRRLRLCLKYGRFSFFAGFIGQVAHVNMSPGVFCHLLSSSRARIG